jgi:hypothetical protein
MTSRFVDPAVVTASWRAVRPARVGAVAAAAAVLVAGTVAWQDEGYAVPVMHGVVLLAACVLALCADDPAAEVVAAAPVPRGVRTLVRLGLGAAVAVPVFVGAALVAELRYEATPLLVLAAEAAAIALAAAALGSVIRARGRHAPAYPTVLGLLVLVFALDQLPLNYLMIDPQPWGPPLEAALIRWAALALLCVAGLVWALRDPARR